MPVELSGCERLTVLALDKNRLTSVPRQLGRLQQLTELSLCGNLLEYLPQCRSQKILTLLFILFYHTYFTPSISEPSREAVTTIFKVFGIT